MPSPTPSADPTADPSTGDAPAIDLAGLAAAHPRCVWLDGAGGHAWSGRTSHVAGLEPDDVSLTYDAARREVVRWTGRPGAWRGVVVGDDPFVVLAAEVAAAPAARWYGYLGYASRPDLPALVPDADDPTAPPDAVWMRPSRVRTVVHPPAGPPPPHTAGDAGPPDPSYAAGFHRVQEALHAGDSYEVNLTRRERVEAAAGLGPVEVHARLRALDPAPYAGFLAHDVHDTGLPARSRAWLVSASPERYARLTPTADGVRVEAKPMKGTAPRGADAVEDARAAEALRTDAKNRAENLMIVDLLRNDVGAVSRPGTVEVPELMVTEAYASVHQLVSTVTGVLRPEVGVVEAVRALFPAGSMTGAPKLRTMQVIAEAETSPRGVYAGAWGWLDGRGADLGVVIRSLSSGDGRSWRAGTGGGITVRSVLADEWAEAAWKVARTVAALG